MFKLFEFIDAILTDSIRLVTGFRLSDWEIGQLLLIEVQTFDRLSKNVRTEDLQFRLKTSALRLFGWSHALGVVHFTRGMKALIQRHPPSSQILSLALYELQKGIPLEFDEAQYLDHRYVLTRSPFFARSLPKALPPKNSSLKFSKFDEDCKLN